jgi:deoxyribodipyrimidine photo-lyase
MAGNKALRIFESKIDQYGEARDIPSMDGTSFLSVHLRFGTMSIRELVRTAIQHDSPGAKKWLTELIWREFYQDILANNPQVVSTTFDPLYKDMVWPGLDEHFKAWKQGQTGYPIIDAAMRCFAETGWMHNRLRMIVASFLTKDLLVDYRKGEKYFAKNLLDFDLASNNGGWQWAASVGCDAQPYFRIFNPYLQSQKFDSEGKFIREWIPELAALDAKSIHQPTEMEAVVCNYPLPIVDHYVQRKLALDLFGEARKSPEQVKLSGASSAES